MLFLLNQKWFRWTLGIAGGGILLLVLITLFTPWSPLDAVLSNKKEIVGTSLSVKEINAIGELVTAEYYGEVMETLSGAYQTQRQTSVQDAYIKLKDAYGAILSTFDNEQEATLFDELGQEGFFDSKEYNLVSNFTGKKDQVFVNYIVDTEWQTIEETYRTEITTPIEAVYSRLISKYDSLLKDITEEWERKPRLRKELPAGRVSRGLRSGKLYDSDEYIQLQQIVADHSHYELLQYLKDLGWTLFAQQYRGRLTVPAREAYQDLTQQYNEAKAQIKVNRQRIIRKKVDSAKIYDSDLYQLIREIFDDKKKQELLDYVHETSWLDAQRAYKQQIDNYIRERQTKSELAYLARGWVKAGFDLTKLTEESFEVADSVLIVRDLYPEVLNADINPYFIPELGIPGFQVIVENKTRLIKLREMEMVKAAAKEHLLQDAYERRILQLAWENGEQSLMEFLGLFAPDSLSYSEVNIQVNKYYFLEKEILADQHITLDEVRDLRSYVYSEEDIWDKAYYPQGKEVQDVDLRTFMDNLAKSSFGIDNVPEWDEFYVRWRYGS